MRRGFGGDLDNDGEQLEAAWSPDGSTIVFTATTARDQAARADVQQSLYAMPADGGEPRRLTGDEASYSQPQFAADGSALYARSNSAHEVRLQRRPAGAVRLGRSHRRGRFHSASSARSAAFQVSPDGETVYLVAEDEGHDRIFSVPSTGGEPRELGRLESGSLSGLQVEGPEDAPVDRRQLGQAP